MAVYTIEVRQDSELPGLSLDIYDGDGTLADLTGYTGKIVFTHPDAPNTELETWTDVTVGDGATSPNFTVADWAPTPPWSAIVAAWGGTLHPYGTMFHAFPVVTRDADGAPWPWLDKSPRIVVKIFPTIA